VALVSTVVVCAPKIFSVIPEPKAAPNPSLRGRCIKITKVSSTQTITRMVSKIGIKIDSHIRAGNMGCSEAFVKGEVWEGRMGETAMARDGDTMIGRAKNSARRWCCCCLRCSAPVLSRCRAAAITDLR
jgi:hypothetical protein